MLFQHGYTKALYFSINNEQTHDVKINSCLDFLLNFKFFGGQGLSWASQVAPEVKNMPASEGYTRDMGLIAGLGTSPREKMLQYFCLEIPWAEAGGPQRVGHNSAHTHHLKPFLYIILASLLNISSDTEYRGTFLGK